MRPERGNLRLAGAASQMRLGMRLGMDSRAAFHRVNRAPRRFVGKFSCDRKWCDDEERAIEDPAAGAGRVAGEHREAGAISDWQDAGARIAAGADGGADR